MRERLLEYIPHVYEIRVPAMLPDRWESVAEWGVCSANSVDRTPLRAMARSILHVIWFRLMNTRFNKGNLEPKWKSRITWWLYGPVR